MSVIRQQVEDVLSEITEDFLQQVSSNPNVSHMRILLKDVEQMLVQSIHYAFEFDQERIVELNCLIETLGTSFYDANIPITLAIDFADSAKRRLLTQLFDAEVDTATLKKIHMLFDNLSNYTAKGYLMKTVDECVDLNLYLISVYKTTKYYTTLINWMNSITNAILANDIRAMPDLNPYMSELGLLIHQPQMELILGENPDESELMRYFEAIYNTANLLAFYFERQNFEKLYVLFQDLNEKFSAFQQKLAESLALFNESAEYHFSGYVKRCLNTDQMLNVMIINVNNLSSINTIFSVDAGEKILDLVQLQIDRFIANTDFNTVYVRTKKDEFRIAVIGLQDGLVKNLADHLKVRLKELSVSHDGHQLPFYLSFGSIAFDSDADYSNLEIEKIYSYVMDKAKRTKEKESIVSKDSIHAVIDQIACNDSRVIQLRDIFRDKNVLPYFQSINRLSDERIFSFEALARFNDVDGDHSFGSYIDLMVELDTVVELDVAMLNGLLKNSDVISKLTNSLFINTNPKSFESPFFVDQLKTFNQSIRLLGVEPIFEITEQAILNNLDVIESLYAHQNLNFALDDFGSGFSSLEMVVKLSEHGLLKFLKIDGTLVKEMVNSEKSAMVVDSIRYMASNLGIQTIAEFIENKNILEQAKKIGINYGQGYELSRPMSLELLRNHVVN